MTRPSPIGKVLAALPWARKTTHGWSARCPSHDDRRPSLSIRETSDGTVLVRCFTGCAADAICRAAGLELRDLFPAPQADMRRLPASAPEKARRMSRQEIEAFYRRALDEVRAVRLADEPWSNPEHTVDDQNRARRRTNDCCGTRFQQLRVPWWVRYPHAHDPDWRTCVERAIDELAWSRDADPQRLRRRIEQLPRARAAVIDRAAKILHELARSPS